MVLLVFLPALLYRESLTTSLREIRGNLRVVLLQSIALVVATAGAVAVVGHLVGLSWPVAWVLGAVLAPTDVTAVAAVARGMPRRTLTILRAESLINDGTALVLFAIALEVATGERAFSWGWTAGSLATSYAGVMRVLALAAVAFVARLRPGEETILTPNGADSALGLPFQRRIPSRFQFPGYFRWLRARSTRCRQGPDRG